MRSNGGADAYVAKLDPAGNFLWARNVGGAGNDIGTALAVDPVSGDVYATGSFAGTAAFGGTTLTSAGNRDIFILKLDTQGNFQWARRAGGSETTLDTSISHAWNGDIGHGIALDGNGQLYVAGNFQGTADFGDTTLISDGPVGGFMSKLTTDGDFVATRQVGGSNGGRIWEVTTDAGGNVYLTGFCDGDATFGATTLTGGGWFVARMNADGNFAWASQLDYSDPIAVGVDGAGNVYVSGHYSVVSKLDADGNHLWRKQVGVEAPYFRDLVVSAAGDVYLCGTFYGPADFDPGPGTFNRTSTWNNANNFYSYDGFILKLDTDGNFLSMRHLSGEQLVSALGIALDAAGNIYTTGTYGRTAAFDTGTAFVNLTSPQSSVLGMEGDTFILKTTQDRGAISGRVFNDLNGNSAWDSGEPPLPGQTVYLDLNSNGKPDADEPTAVVDADGLYYFWHLEPGEYIVRQALQPGWSQTFGSTADTVAVSGGRFVGNQDFGNTFPNQTITYTSTDVPKNIPNRSWQEVYSTLTISDSYTIFDIKVSVNISGSGTSGGTLIAPDGTRTGFNYKDIRGTWQLEVSGGSGGKLLGWSITVIGASMPQIGALAASPTSVSPGASVTLTANNVLDRYPGGTVTSVSFYRDANDSGTLDANDVLVGTDINSGNGWSATASTTGLATGSYTFYAVAKNNYGVISTPAAATVTVSTGSGGGGKGKGGGKKLMADSHGNNAHAQSLSAGQFQLLISEALTRLSASGADITPLSTLDIRIADLPGNTLGLASGNTIWLDSNAAGWGWFVDSTPHDDSEFYLPGNQGEQGRLDLLTVLMHGMGHVLGMEHDDHGVMQETLSAGERWMLGQDDMAVAPIGCWAQRLDALFATLATEGDEDLPR